MNKFVIVLCCFLAACSQSVDDSNLAIDDVSVAQEELYHSHYVIYPGETLGIISSWYSGTPNNWQAISAANDNLDPGKVQLGQQIKIPTNIITNYQPITQEYVSKFYNK